MSLSNPGTPLPGITDLKAQAKRLRAAMSDHGTPISQSTALETIARQWGFRDWNTLSARARSADTVTNPGWFVGQRVGGHYLGHPVSGVLKAVRGAAKGFCHITVVFD
ncbi:MAG: glyoxalase superfamily protein, partial [Pseudomonadota bacterium]